MKIKSKEVLVKWVGFPNPTWENENGIPKFIRNYYEKNPAKLGKVLPNPKIKHSKTIGGTVIHKLSWGDDSGAEWINEDFFKLFEKSRNQQNPQAVIPESRGTSDRTYTVLGSSQGPIHVWS